jgi:septal ring factor EnvC (AmiA/AmiB activator)
MFNKQLKQNIKELDNRVGKLYEQLDKAQTDEERKQLLEQAKELADLRNKLSEGKTRESLLPVLIPAAVGLTAMFMVIRHEETNIITTKALGLATKFIRGH